MSPPRFTESPAAEAATPAAYPFSSSVTFSANSSGVTVGEPSKKGKQRASITSLCAFPASHPNARLLPLFARRRSVPTRIPLLSIVNVVSSDPPPAVTPSASGPQPTHTGPTTSSFTGVLTSVRHKGIDTSFVLRSIVGQTGVEVRFFLASPLLKEVQVIRRAGEELGGTGTVQIKKPKRAKITYLRDQPRRMPNLRGAIRGMEKAARS